MSDRAPLAPPGRSLRVVAVLALVWNLPGVAAAVLPGRVIAVAVGLLACERSVQRRGWLA